MYVRHAFEEETGLLVEDGGDSEVASDIEEQEGDCDEDWL